MKIKLFISLIILLFSNAVYSQETNFEKLVDSLFTKANEKTAVEDKVRILTGNAGKYGYRDFTKQLIDKSIEISEKEKSSVAKANSYYSLGNYFFFRLKLDTAKTLFLNALELIEKEKSASLEAQILTSLSGIYKKEGDYSTAISSLFQAKELLEKINTDSLTEREKAIHKGRGSIIDNSLATSYVEMEDYESAIYYYDLCYKTSMELKNPTVAGSVLSNKGELLTKMEKYEEALIAHNRAKELKTTGDAPKRSLAISELNVGIVLSHTNKYEEAMQSFKNALTVFKEVNYPVGQMNTYVERGQLQLKTNKNKEAIKDCENAKTIAFELKDAKLQEQACKCLHQAYKKSGNAKLALLNHELYLEKKELIRDEKNIKKITQLEMQYDFDRKEEVQEAENIAKEKESNLIIKSLIGGVGALLLIALLLYRLFRTRKKAGIKLESKNKQVSEALEEKEVLLKEIHHRVKNNLQIISSLLSIQGRQISDPLAKQAINEGKNRVKAMALIHQNLYQSENLVGVDAADYIHKLTDSLVQNYNTSDNDIEITTNIDELKLDIDTIIPFGLMINELISNSLKYAFVDSKIQGKIHIKLVKESNNLVLEVSDNGIGLPKDFEITKTTSLGYKLIKAFSKKLNAKLELGKNIVNQGTKVRLEIVDFKTI